MAVSPVNGAGAPAGADVVHLGHGFYYNLTMKLLTTPWREIVPWEEGQPLPKQPQSQAVATNPFMQAAATPWNNWAPPPGSGWGGYPVNDDSAKVKELQAQLAEDKRQRDLQQLRDEMQKQNAAMSAALERLAAALTAKPAGPSETEMTLKRELELERQRREQTEREERIRADMRMQQERIEAQIAAITANKTDPMMPMLLQLIASVQSNASETVKSIQAATQSGMASSERSTQLMLQQLSGSILSPLQLTQLMQQARGDSAEGARHIVEATRESMAMQREVFTNLLELSSQGDQPAWLQAIREVSGTVVGPLGNMLAQRQQQQQVAQQPARRQVQQVRQPPAQQMPGAPMQAPPVALPPAAAASDAAHQQRTAVPKTGVETVRDRAAASVAHFQHAPSSPGAQGADVTQPKPTEMNGAGSGVVAAPVLGEVATGGTVTPIAAAAKKPSRRRKKDAAPPPPPEPPKGFTMDQMRDADPDVLREMVAELDDDHLFGVTLGYVQQLRASGDSPEKMAESILASRQYISSFGGTIPPGMELLIAQQTVVLVERLLPDVSEEIRAAVVEELDAALEAENGGGEEDDDEDEEGEEEEGDDEGDEADAN